MKSNLLLFSWLLAAPCLAGSMPEGSIAIRPRSSHEVHSRRTDGPVDEEDIEVFGPLVRRAIHNGSAMLIPRTSGEPGVDGWGPLLSVPGCLICPGPELTALSGWDLLARLDTPYMQSTMRISNKADLLNKCVFYTRADKKPPPNLSKAASLWACKHQKYSIWHLWPNKFMAQQSTNYKDFYGIEEKDNWLHSIHNLQKMPDHPPPQIQYFENMSKAMALSCSGEVIIMTQTPDNMAQYLNEPNIWRNKERPALMNLFERKIIKRFRVVDYNNQDKIWEFDIETNTKGDPVDPKDLESRSLADGSEEAKLLRRDICDSTGLDQILSKGDPFSDNYADFE